LVADTSSTCTTTGAQTTGSVVLTTSLPVTSKAVSYPAALGTSGNSAAVLRILVAGADSAGSPYFGSVNGSQVSFANVTLPLGAFTLVSSNIRVNASTGGAPQVTETVLVSFATVVGGTS